jgi:hypothetical protein
VPLHPADARSRIAAALAALRGGGEILESAGLGISQRKTAKVEHTEER